MLVHFGQFICVLVMMGALNPNQQPLRRSCVWSEDQLRQALSFRRLIRRQSHLVAHFVLSAEQVWDVNERMRAEGLILRILRRRGALNPKD